MDRKLIEEAVMVIRKILPQYKPDGIGGSCGCDACNENRPTYQALDILLSLAQERLDGKVGEYATEEEIRKIIEEHWIASIIPEQIAKALVGKIGRKE